MLTRARRRGVAGRLLDAALGALEGLGGGSAEMLYESDNAAMARLCASRNARLTRHGNVVRAVLPVPDMDCCPSP